MRARRGWRCLRARRAAARPPVAAGPAVGRRWVGFGVTEPLRFGENRTEILALPLHCGQDVVAGAVENAFDSVDPVADHALSQGLQDRGAGAHGGFEQQARAVRLGTLRQVQTMLRDHRLVGRDQRPAMAERFARKIECRTVGPADHLGDRVDSVEAREFDGIIAPAARGEVDSPVPRAVARADRDDLDRPSGACFDQCGMLGQQADDSCAHRAQPRDSQSECLAHGAQRCDAALAKASPSSTDGRGGWARSVTYARRLAHPRARA